MLETCAVSEGIEVVQEFKRLGKEENGKDRPILVMFKDVKYKDDLFKNLKNLGTAPEHLKMISVNHDMSKAQRETTKNLWTEAKKKQEEDPQHRYRVRGRLGYQKIVQLEI